MNSVAVSLIIPVYNVEKYLPKALESVESQTLKNIEVIIVDDGSTDKSIEIIKEFCSRNPNFKFISQCNKGPGSARNAALSISQGEYIAFLDSDDYLEPTFLESLYTTAVKHQADIVCCNFKVYYPQQNIRMYLPFHSLPGVYTKTQALRKLILDVGMHYYVWNKLYKRIIFSENNFTFENMYFEDVSVSPKLFYAAEKIVLIKDCLYNYTSRETSILHSMNTEKINDFIKSIGVIRNFLELENAYKNYSNHLWIYAQKSKIVAYYYLINLHAKAVNFKGFLENIAAATKSIDYFVNSEFIPQKQDNKIEVPFPIKQPEKNNKIKKKSREFTNKN